LTPIEVTFSISRVLEKLVNQIAEDGWKFTDGGIDYENLW
jgi:hypothetical protein